MTTLYLQQWLGAFVITQVVEMPVYRFGFGVRWPVAFLASTLTHPVVWFVIPHIISLNNYWLYFAVAESFAVLAEAAWLAMKGTQRRRALMASLCANGLSASLGLLRWYVIGKLFT